MTTHELGKMLLLARNIKGFSQENIAYDLGITPQAYSKIENGRVSTGWDRVQAICEILGFSNIFELKKWHEQIQQINKK